MNMIAIRLRSALLAGALAGGASAADAQTAPAGPVDVAARATTNHISNFVDLTGSVGYSTNPRLTTSGRGSSSSVLGRVSARAVHSVVTDRSSVNLTAFVENESYVRGAGSTQAFDLGASISRIMSPRLSLYANAGFSGDIGGQLYSRFISVPSAPPVIDINNPLPPSNLFDPAFISLNRRQYRLNGQGGLSYRFSDRDSINVSAGAAHVWFSGGGPSLNYDTINGSLGWDRMLTERASAGLRLSVARSEYHSRGHSTSYNPQVTASTRLAEDWQVSGAVGASFIQQDTLTDHGHSTALSFDLSACRNSPIQSICITADRSAQSSIGQGLVNATSAALSYYRRLGARDTVQLGVSAVRSSGGDVLLIGGPTTYYGGSASYNRTLSQRLSTGVEASVSKVDQSGGSVPTRATATIFLRYRLGDLQ